MFLITWSKEVIIESTNRLKGSKRRKSGKVRKFQNESTVIEDVQSGDKSEADHGVEKD
ncbi:hypothetical protein MKX03_019857, partial [Papaver bracteatum]